MNQVILFTSLKGGVGKTTAAASLATSLAFYKKRVLCVDFDFGVRGLDMALGAENSCGADALEVIRLGSSPTKEAVRLDEYLSFLPAPAFRISGEEALPTSEMLSRFLARCKEEFEFTLLDLPAGGGELFLPLSRDKSLTRAIVVTTPDPSAIRAAEQTGYEIRSCGDAQISLILNRVPSVKKKQLPSFFEMASQAGIDVLGVVSEDPFAAVARQEGIALSRLPQAPSSRAFWNIASRLCGGQVSLLKGVKDTNVKL